MIVRGIYEREEEGCLGKYLDTWHVLISIDIILFFVDNIYIANAILRLWWQDGTKVSLTVKIRIRKSAPRMERVR